MKVYTVSPTFDEVFPIEMTQQQYIDMLDDGYALFDTEEEAQQYLEEDKDILGL